MNHFTVLHRRSGYSHLCILAVTLDDEMGIEDMNQDMEGYIVIVNGDPTMRQTVSGYFSDHNVPTISASNWNELKCTGTPPNLIIMDQQFGLNDGLDRLRSIRSKGIPVIITGQRPDEIDCV